MTISKSPSNRMQRSGIACAVLLSILLLTTGCNKFKMRHEHREMVYVWTRQMYLRDRVAAVSNRVGEVDNGDALEVLEHGKRFLRVKTQKNEIGWIPDRAVIDSKTYDTFTQLATQHKDDPVIANATVRDDVYLHVSPGGDSDRFYLLPGNAKVQMLVRASLVKGGTKAPTPHAAAPAVKAAKPAVPAVAKGTTAAQGTKKQEPTVVEAEPQPVLMEDWWLIRDTQGHAGWVLGRRVDVDVPDDVAQYAEGQRIVGAYVIAKVHDEEANTPNHEVSEYVTALSPTASGLPFDFDQIRLFTWSVKRHRYETAFRVHPIQGFLPVKISSEPGQGGATEPVFSFQVASSPDIVINPDTGIAKPASMRTISYALRDTTVKRVGPDMGPIPTMHVPGEKAKVKAGKKRK